MILFRLISGKYLVGFVHARSRIKYFFLLQELGLIMKWAAVAPVLESDAEPGGRKFVQLGAWENAYFATISKSRQTRVNCIVLANLRNLWCSLTPWSWNYQHVGTVLCSQKSETHSSKNRKADNKYVQQGTSQIKSEIRSLPRPSWTGWLRKTCFGRLREG